MRLALRPFGVGGERNGQDGRTDGRVTGRVPACVVLVVAVVAAVTAIGWAAGNRIRCAAPHTLPADARCWLPRSAIGFSGGRRHPSARPPSMYRH